MFGTFKEIRWDNADVVEIGQKYQAHCIKIQVQFIVAVDVKST